LNINMDDDHQKVWKDVCVRTQQNVVWFHHGKEAGYWTKEKGETPNRTSGRFGTSCIESNFSWLATWISNETIFGWFEHLWNPFIWQNSLQTSRTRWKQDISFGCRDSHFRTLYLDWIVLSGTSPIIINGITS
jgi:hypothetical protein